MLSNLRSLKRKHIVFIGDNAVDIVLYVTRICSFNYKILLVDLSGNGSLFGIVSPDGYMENQNIRLATGENISTELEKSFDLIITYTDLPGNVPTDLLVGDIYVFATPGKDKVNKILMEAKTLYNVTRNLYFVCRGSDKSDILMKRLLVSGVTGLIFNKMFFICDSENDSSVMWQMEYNSVFLYEHLSRDIRRFLTFVYDRVYEMFDMARVPEDHRFKWVM